MDASFLVALAGILTAAGSLIGASVAIRNAKVAAKTAEANNNKIAIDSLRETLTALSEENNRLRNYQTETGIKIEKLDSELTCWKKRYDDLNELWRRRYEELMQKNEDTELAWTLQYDELKRQYEESEAAWKKRYEELTRKYEQLCRWAEERGWRASDEDHA